MYSGDGRRFSMANKDGSCGEDDARLCAIVGRSHVLGTKPNAKTAAVTESDLPQSYSATFPPPQLDAATNFFSTSNSDNDVLPPFDLVASVALPPAVQCRKFLADLRPLDRILARVVRPGVAVLHVELVCMLSRFRRTLLTFMKGRLCFNKALNVYEHCADAYVGRGAACAGCRNFPAALTDLERAVQLQPNHRNANKYRQEVLHTYAKELERDGKLTDARAKFGQLLALCPDHQGALDGIARLDKNDDNIGGTGIELVELSDDEHTDHDDDNGINDGHNGGPLNNSDRRKRRQSENGTNRRHSAAGENGRKSQNGCQTECGAGRAKRRETMSEEEAQRNRQKLAEMEAFIAKLKGAGGGGGGSGGTPKVTGGGSGEKR